MSTSTTSGQSLTNHADESSPDQSNLSTRVKANENTGITKLNDHLTDTNYNTWKGQMMLTLEICGVEEYAKGVVEKPNVEDHWRWTDRVSKIGNSMTVTPEA